ncbi:hypothetical protein NQ317_003486 [Molorchus minor]|uniref:PDZ domain-containing protein n=1 Tax=Molorchus minor TaxID=1323400 RepID=A0ABQ9K0S7_9CUCU|nr:hypothetical protein NQ317_003486 [Molorchus minor]
MSEENIEELEIEQEPDEQSDEEFENGAAYYAGGLEVGQLILQVDGTRVDGLQHQDVARLIAESFARRDRKK